VIKDLATLQEGQSGKVSSWRGLFAAAIRLNTSGCVCIGLFFLARLMLLSQSAEIVWQEEVYVSVLHITMRNATLQEGQSGKVSSRQGCCQWHCGAVAGHEWGLCAGLSLVM
jgi:hypothetical protein